MCLRQDAGSVRLRAFVLIPQNLMIQATAQAPQKRSTAKKQPDFKNKFGNISVAVFTDEVTHSDGASFTAANFALQKSWQDAQGDWQDATLYLKRREILPVLVALQEAYSASYNLAADDTAED